MKIPEKILNSVETPFYFYDTQLLDKTLETAIAEANKYGYNLHYALKANNNIDVLRRISKKGYGADCVSGNEIKLALESGFDAKKIAFAGVGKTDKEIIIGLENGIFSFNVESIPELENINELAIKYGKIANVALRINPNVNANTHHYITTGLEENKFGINAWELPLVISKLNDLKGIKLKGIHFHIGSQITDLNIFANLCTKVNQVQQSLFSNQIIVDSINVGGGFGINYHDPDMEPIPDFKSFFSTFHRFLNLRPNQTLHFELGRSLVGQFGSLISKVIYIKEGAAKKFAIIDASMTDLIRPALYQSYHAIETVNTQSDSKDIYDIVGPVCESTDIFRKTIEMPTLKRGDIIAIRSTGAYGEVMSSNYNLRDKAAVVLS
jgi:diaminopimelate decarboxylase